jgi:MFS family permease
VGLALIGIGYGMFAPPTLSLVLGQYPNRRGQVSSIMMTFRDMGIVLGTVLFETVFSASSEGSASIHQASAQMVAHGFHNSVMIGIAATVMALTISSMIRD